MMQTPQVGLPDATPAPPASDQGNPVLRVVLVTAAVGVLSVLATWAWFSARPPTPELIGSNQPVLLVALLLVAVVSELLFFPVRHDDGFEELTYFEFVMVGALLLFTPTTALPILLAGTALAELILGRPGVKRLFNIGSYAIATSALFVTYWTLADDDRFTLRSIAALFLASVVWGVINLILLGRILQVAEGIPIREFLADKGQWIPTLIVAFLSVSVAASFVALVPVAPALTVFTVVPTAVLWYVYQAAQRRAEAVDRVRYTVSLSAALATPQDARVLVADAADNVRKFFGAENVLVVHAARSYFSARDDHSASRRATFNDCELATWASAEARTIPAELLPSGWRDGSVIRLDGPHDAPSALALGTSSAISGIEARMPWARGGRFSWKLATEDRPVLSSLAGSVSSALRANQLFLDLQDETAQLAAVVDHASDGIAVFDREGRVVRWSPAMTTITGLSPDLTAQSAVVPDTGLLAELAALRGTDTDDDGLDRSIERPDGEQRDINVAVVSIHDEAELSVMTVRDVTQQRRLERMKSDFIATVSHELRTPITPIKGYAQLLSSRWDRMTPEKRGHILGTIEERANHLSRLVDDLLLASRASDVASAMLDVSVSPGHLTELVDRAVASLPDLGPQLTVTGGDAPVLVDFERAVQCLTNLIGNAGKYSPPDSPIRVEYGPLDGEPWAVVTVIDQGRGIPAEELDRVFEKFYRVEDPMTMTTSGNGLGLFISRELARAMNGDINVESTLGRGSRFHLRLPVEEVEATP
jgi:PAS domain S-box-containing protein